jgi:hypothetical protein
VASEWRCTTTSSNINTSNISSSNNINSSNMYTNSTSCRRQ